MDTKNINEKIKPHLEPDRLERYSFLWSEARLIIAALALFLGGVPPLLWFLVRLLGPYAYNGLFWVRPILTIAWIISGAASAYLLYRWNKDGQKIFGGKAQYDTWAFWVSVISGFNLGIAGLFGRNIGIAIAPFYGIFVLVGLLYLVTAVYLYSRWKASGQKLF